jgi:formylglycine-generating enzyme required for sulfatase activity
MYPPQPFTPRFVVPSEVPGGQKQNPLPGPSTRLRALVPLLGLLLACAGARGQALLQASLKPTIAINGPLGSTQEIQAASSANTNHWTTLGFVRMSANPSYFTDATATGATRFYRSITVGLEDTNLVWIPPGTFVMGSPTNEAGRSAWEGPQTTVTLTSGFFMGRYEVRNFDYIQIMGAMEVDDSGLTNYLLCAARQIAWPNATNYCALRTAAESAAGKIPAGWAYRLPTEAEWEYACRAGTTTAFYYGNQLRADSVLGIDAIFAGRFPYPTGLLSPAPIDFGGPRPVGGQMPNAFGLYDMHGNVWEWCADTFLTNSPPIYPGGSVTNYAVLGGNVNAIARGGGWESRGVDCRSAARLAMRTFPSFGSETGFRVVLAPK